MLIQNIAAKFILLVLGVLTAYLVDHPIYTLSILGAFLLMFLDEPLLVVATLPLLVVFSSVWFTLGVLLFPHTFDQSLSNFDNLLGFSPSAAVQEVFLLHPWLDSTARMVYNSITLVFALIALDRTRARGFILKILLSCGTACLASCVLPACGPVYLAAGQLATRPRDCMPSAHLVWALLLFWHGRGWPRLAQVACGFYLALTALATLGMGEHYLIDLVVAVPCALAMDAAVEHRWSATVAGLGLVAYWIVVLRFFQLVSPGHWLIALGTIMLSGWWAQLARVSTALGGGSSSALKWFRKCSTLPAQR